MEFVIKISYKKKQTKSFIRRQSRTVQANTFDFYAEHAIGHPLSYVSQLLDQHDDVLSLIEQDLIGSNTKNTGRHGLTLESVFRCFYIKRAFQASYEHLALLLYDSQSLSAFTRLARIFHQHTQKLAFDTCL